MYISLLNMFEAIWTIETTKSQYSDISWIYVAFRPLRVASCAVAAVPCVVLFDCEKNRVYRRNSASITTRMFAHINPQKTKMQSRSICNCGFCALSGSVSPRSSPLFRNGQSSRNLSYGSTDPPWYGAEFLHNCIAIHPNAAAIAQHGSPYPAMRRRVSASAKDAIFAPRRSFLRLDGACDAMQDWEGRMRRGSFRRAYFVGLIDGRVWRCFVIRWRRKRMGCWCTGCLMENVRLLSDMSAKWMLGSVSYYLSHLWCLMHSPAAICALALPSAPSSCTKNRVSLRPAWSRDWMHDGWTLWCVKSIVEISVTCQQNGCWAVSYLSLLCIPFVMHSPCHLLNTEKGSTLFLRLTTNNKSSSLVISTYWIHPLEKLFTHVLELDQSQLLVTTPIVFINVTVTNALRGFFACSLKFQFGQIGFNMWMYFQLLIIWNTRFWKLLSVDICLTMTGILLIKHKHYH